MRTCPFCRHSLPDAALERPTCIYCGGELSSLRGEAGPASPGEGSAPAETCSAPPSPLPGGDSREVAGGPREETFSRQVDPEPPVSGEPPPPAGEFDWAAQTMKSEEEPAEGLPGMPGGLDSLALLEDFDWSDASAGRTIRREVPVARASMRLAVKSRSLRGAGERLSDRTSPDYEILRLLGEGGMGVVYEARQTAVDRTVALKMIRTDVAVKESAQAKFLAEGAVTGELDHPNIVPIYDMGTNEEGLLFYAMKRVQGVPWDRVIAEKPLSENLEILLRVCDGVAFAHSRGIVHRDLKPENIMLGSFGEVLIMDWGLAVSVERGGKAGTVTAANALAGTPAYMAPEMALGDAEHVGLPSDIYLLGAILYEIVTGRRPHAGKSLRDCLRAASENVIQPGQGDRELIPIALQAMEYDPRERYKSVQAFQGAIREYRAHAESITLTRRAEEDLHKATGSRNYDDFTQALYRLREAINLWEENRAARNALSGAHHAYAVCAFEKGDYDLAWSLLNPLDAVHLDLIGAVRMARWRRDIRARRMRLLKISAGTLSVFVLGALVVIVYWALSERTAFQAMQEESRLHQIKVAARDAEGKRATGALEEVRSIAGASGDAAATLAGIRSLLSAAKVGQGETDWPFDEETARRRRAEAAAGLGVPVERAIRLAEGVELPLVLIPAGVFDMGSDPQESSLEEETIHRVRIMPPFYMARTEVTQAAWQALTGANPSQFSREPDSPRRPVEGVSWEAIRNEFLPRLNALAPPGWRFRLPTEAEWEYACRAGSKECYSHGAEEEALERAGWYRENSIASSEPKSARATHPVGTKSPNAWGLYDMHGNVWEWCEDRYDPGFYKRSPVENPVNRAEEGDRVLRGGAYDTWPKRCRAAARKSSETGGLNSRYGFRVVLVPSETAEEQ
ncbi:MAG: bifunctional serine/threonine-protein kinase/formylglycine-generating enzyme family protein [Planctomycetota bacterium]